MSNAKCSGPWPDRYARNVRMVEAYAAGVTMREIAEREGVSHVTVLNVLRTAGINTKMNAKRRRAPMNVPRDEAIVTAHGLGESLAAIGRRYELSRQRIEQIVVKTKRAENGADHG